ncbi:MAG: MlaD family protein [Chromatiaceae bacterium]|nr:MlaD family protein [Chromatiaceae bacterium]
MTASVDKPAGTEIDEPGAELPLGEAFTRGRLSIVWLIPVLALLVGGWLAYKTWSEKGPTISIAFKAAAGLQVGKTLIKFKDVEVGKVTAIRVAEDLKEVLVTAELVAGTEPWLTKRTRFWIARPRIAAGRVSGLDTLLSGAFIEMDPVTEGKRARDYIGLEEPPFFKTDELGKRFTLRSADGGIVTAGAPVYYRSKQVGQVVSSRLDDAGEEVDIEVFIGAPHDRLVRTNSRFWNTSGLDLTLDAGGVRLDSESFMTILIGGIVFATPATIDEESLEAPAGATFRLYKNRDEADARVYESKKQYLMFFDGSVRGLQVGAPVMLRGIAIGKVLDVRLDFDIADFAFEIPVLIEIEPERVNMKGDADTVNYDRAIEQMVAAGLRGQLQTGSLITGQLYVELGFHPSAPPASITEEQGYKVVPTVPASLEAITTKVDNLLDTFGRLPLEKIASNALGTVEGVNRLVNSAELASAITALGQTLSRSDAALAKIDKQVVPEMAAALSQARATLSAVQGLVARDSAMVAEIRRLMHELTAAARSVNELADYLERHPEALIRGKGTR